MTPQTLNYVINVTTSGGGAQAAAAQFTQMNATLQAILRSTNSLNLAQAQYAQSTNTATQANNSFHRSFLNLLPVIGLISAAFNEAKKDIDAFAKSEGIESTLRAITGSSTEATKEMEFLRQESNRIGISFASTAPVFARFEAAARGVGMSVDLTHKTFTSLANAARVFNLDAGTTQSVFLAIEQMVSKGTVSMQELRLQLGNALPGAMNTAAKAMGMTQAKLMELVSSGQLATSEFLPKFIAQLDKEIPSAADNTMAKLELMKNALFELRAQLGESMPVGWFVDMATKVMGGMSQTMKNNDVLDSYRNMDDKEFAAAMRQAFPLANAEDVLGRNLQVSPHGGIRSPRSVQINRPDAYFAMEREHQDAANKITGNFMRWMNYGQSPQSELSKKQIHDAEELRKINEKISLEGMEGFEKQRRQAEIVYNDELAKIMALKVGVIDKFEASENAAEGYAKVLAKIAEDERIHNAHNADEEERNIGMLINAKLDAEAKLEKKRAAMMDEEDAAINKWIAHWNSAAHQQALAIYNMRQAGDVNAAIAGYGAPARGSNRALRGLDPDEIQKRQEAQATNQFIIQDALANDTLTTTQAIQLGFKEATSESANFSKNLSNITSTLTGSFASGMASAFTGFISGTKSAGEAFRQFAASFLQQISDMIIQSLILKAINSAASAWGGGGGNFSSGVGGGGVAGVSGGGSASSIASMIPRNAYGGLYASSTSTMTGYGTFGESGYEVGAFLARPKFEYGGITGDVNGRRMALTQVTGNGAGVGGTIVIKVVRDQGVDAQLLQAAVRGAVVEVENQINQDTSMRRSIRSMEQA